MLRRNPTSVTIRPDDVHEFDLIRQKKLTHHDDGATLKETSAASKPGESKESNVDMSHWGRQKKGTTAERVGL